MRERTGVDACSAELLDLEPSFSPQSRAAREAWLARERPQIAAFDYALAAGLAMIWVYDDAVAVGASLGCDDAVWKSAVLATAHPA